MDRRPELRRSMTLSEQLSTPDQAIRDFLKIPTDDSHLDADRTAADSGGMWKPLRDRLRLRRAANAWSSSTPSQKSPTTSSDSGGTTNGGNLKNNNNNRSNKYIYAPGEATAAFSRTTSLRQAPTFSRASSTRVGPAAAIGRMERAREITHDDDDEGSEEEPEHDEEDDDEDEEEEKDADEAPAAQMSLMALLGQSDDTWDEDDEDDEGDGGAAAGRRGGARKDAARGGDDEEEDGEGEGREEEMVHVCCVCMVRHKGAAFIPCGHTFCRLCSRELWVSRGNCPLCNGFIQEILDIF